MSYPRSTRIRPTAHSHEVAGGAVHAFQPSLAAKPEPLGAEKPTDSTTHRERTGRPPNRPKQISRGGDRANGANHPSETHKKCLRKPLSRPHRCLYKQHQETFTSVDDR